MRKSIGATALAGLAVLALSLSAQAQDKAITTSNPDTLKVSVSGSVALDWVWHDEMSNFARGTTTGFSADGASESGDLEAVVRIALDIDLSDSVTANITIGNNDLSSTGGSITTGPAVLSNNTETVDIFFTDVSMTFAEILDPAVTIRVGTQNHAFDIRGNGSAFFFDPRNSESFANNTFQGSAAGAAPDFSGQDVLQPAGLTLTYVRDKLEVNLIAWTAIEGGRAAADEANLGADFYYQLSENTRLGGILMLTGFGANDPLSGVPFSASVSETQVATIGGGIVMSGLMPNLDLYAEIYIQSGDAGVVGTTTMEAGGTAMLIGADYKLSDKTSLGGSITIISGDGSADGDQDNFLTYESVNDLLILEDQAFGVDIDTNLTLIKAYITHQLRPNLSLKGMLGMATATEKIAGPTGTNDALGMEIDVTLSYSYSSSVNFTGRIGMLTGSDVLEAGAQPFMGTEADDSASIVTIGTDFTF